MSKKTIIIIIFSVLWIMVAQISKAAVINVTTMHDNVPGSLRAAITTANANGEDDIIHLPAGVYYLSGEAWENHNRSGDLDIDNGQKITIIGEDPRTTIIDGNEVDRALHILNGTVSISYVTIRRGKTIDWPTTSLDGGNGGGICNNGYLTLFHCEVDSNATGDDSNNPDSPSDDCGGGGGIYNKGSLVLTNCTIGNNVTGSGYVDDWGTNGGDGAGIYNNHLLTLTNCTISNNRNGDGGQERCKGGDGGNGGGIFNNSDCTVFITSCTISNNNVGEGGGYDGHMCRYTSYGKYGSGGGIYNGGIVKIKNTIIANNVGNGPDCYGTLTSQGYNLIRDTWQCTITGIKKGNIIGFDPLLRGLADNGGYTQTQSLRPGSPAIDAGYSYGSSIDQRGFVRPHNIPGITDVKDGSDIGAYEYESSLSYHNISGKITYKLSGLPGVTITFSDKGGTASTDAGGNYSHPVSYGWSGTVTPSKTGYTFSPSDKTYHFVTIGQAGQDYTAVSVIPSYISLSRTQLNFGADTTGKQTPSQSFLISNSGGGTLNWTAGDNADWLNCNPTSGIGPAMITVSIDTSALSPGDYTGMITIADPNAVNSPQTVKVKLIVYDTGSAQPPFGSFDTPLSGSTVTGSIPATGWAIDNIGLESVKIYRNATTAGSSEFVYIGDAIFVEGARPDIETLYPDYPNSYKAGWGYLLLTNALPDQGNGNFTLYARATNKEGNTVTLGSKTITCDNANAVKPFGAIDTPAQGGPVSGNNYVNFGWALTPLPNTILTNGSTITVWVNGVPLGHPVYNENRPDVAALFPNYNNSDGAGGHFLLNTSNYPNGVHTIAWTVSDNAGNADGIGSRYFTIQNTGGDLFRRGAAAFSAWSPVVDAGYAVSGQYGAVRVKKGFNPDIEANEVYPDEEGVIHIEIQELERVEIHLSPGTINVSPLPIGSTMDSREGIFYWQPGPGFIGQYRLVFEEKEGTGPVNRKEVVVTICPISLKFSSAWSSIDCGKR